VAGGLIVLWTIGGEYFPELGQAGRLLELRFDAIEWTRLIIDNGFAPQFTPYAVGLGVVMWVTSFMAAYTIYRHHRVIDAILLVGAALIANMSATFTDLFGYLVLFMLAALLLWLRSALIGREESWLRRRVNENVDVPGAIMRSGVLFIAGSIAMAWILTTVAVAAPLTAVWNNLDGVWTEVRDRFEGLVGGINNSDSRITGPGFGPNMNPSGQWQAHDDPVMTVTAQGRYYLSTISYNEYTGHGFRQTDFSVRDVAQGQPVFPDYTPERPLVAEAFTKEAVTIVFQESTGRNLFTPGYPLLVSAPISVVEPEGQPVLGGLRFGQAIPEGTGYDIVAAISHATEAQLSAAGDEYPESITGLYLGTEGVTQRTRDLAQQLVDDAGAETPYEKAKALAAFLHSDSSFEYRTVAPVPPSADLDFVDWFLFDEEDGRIGYCEYYSMAMAVMARTLGLPSRVVGGYAPGDRIGEAPDGEGSVYQVRLRNAHSWAEVYFPGYGWQIFEATPAVDSVRRPAGEPLPTPGPGAVATPAPFDEGVDGGLLNPGNLPSVAPLPGGGRVGEDPVPPDSTGGNTLVITAIILVVVGIGLLRWRRTRRAFRFLAPGERQWRRLALAADRAGVAQRPSETIYEYAGWLEEQIPARRPDIRTIADGKVWQSYSGRGVSSAAIARIEEAWRRLQLPMVWLTVRRRLRHLVPRRG
jgi:transglutaminase-like putative cysteine protease